MYTEIQIQEYICDKGCMLLYVQGVETQRQERIYTRIGIVHRDTDNRGEYGKGCGDRQCCIKGVKIQPRYSSYRGLFWDCRGIYA
jgi:hypothetical protein